MTGMMTDRAPASTVKRRWNIFLPAGFFLSIVSFLSYYSFFAAFPLTRDIPWVNLLLFGVALSLLAAGLFRAYRSPELYRGRIFGPILAAPALAIFGFFIYLNFGAANDLPPSSMAPRPGQQAPDLALVDMTGAAVKLGDLVGGEKGRWALLVFYRGYW